MPGIIANPIANYGGTRGVQPEPPYVPTYEAIYFAGEDQYYYSGSNLFGVADRRGGISRTFFRDSGSLEPNSQWYVTSNGVGGGSNTPLRPVAAGSLREFTTQFWYFTSGSTQYKRIQTTNKREFPFAAIEYADDFPDTSGDVFGSQTALDESYILVFGQEFLRTSATDTHTGGIAKLPYSTITSSFAGDSTFKSNVGDGPSNNTIGGAGGQVHFAHSNYDKKIGVAHNGKGWDNVTGSYHDFVVLNNDGSRDTNFLMASGSFTDQFGTQYQNGGTRAVYFFDNPADGKKRWIVAGEFKQFGGTTYNHIMAFDETGSIDTTFNSGGTGFNSKVSNIFKVDNDFMCVVGQFTSYNGSTAYGAAVIRYDGALLNSAANHDGNEVFDGVYYDNYLYLRGDFKNFTVGGVNYNVNGIISCQTNFSTKNPNYFIGTGSFTTDIGYSDIFDTGSSQPVEVFLG